MVLMTIFWILLILTAIGTLVPDTAWPHINRARFFIVLLLITILGLRVFDSPLAR